MKFLDWIRGKRDEVLALEEKGRALLATGDGREYQAVMKQKAELLAGLAQEADVYLPACSAQIREFAEEGLGSFSASARTALKLNSVFFMSALLYPDEHKAGEPNNLELFVEELEDCEG